MILAEICGGVKGPVSDRSRDRPWFTATDVCPQHGCGASACAIRSLLPAGTSDRSERTQGPDAAYLTRTICCWVVLPAVCRR